MQTTAPNFFGALYVQLLPYLQGINPAILNPMIMRGIVNPGGNYLKGVQFVVDEHGNILELIPNYLPAALKKGISDIQKMVESLDGIFIPAHVDRPSNGLFSQLGFIPPGLKFDAMGISRWNSEKDVRKHYVLGKEITLIRNSDAHYLQQIGEIYTLFNMQEVSFTEIKSALNQLNNRFVKNV